MDKDYFYQLTSSSHLNIARLNKDVLLIQHQAINSDITLSKNDKEVWIYYKNESFLAWSPVERKTLAIAPDCINLLLSKKNGHFSSRTPLSTADISQGQHCTIWGTACSSKMRNPAIESLFQIDIQQILTAFPDDKIIINGYTNLEILNG